MGILDDYFKGSDAPAAIVPTQSSGIINQYMDDVTHGDVTIDPKTGRPRIIIVSPPISDATPEQSATINAASSAKPVYTGGPVTPRATNIPVNAFNAGLDAAKAGVNQMGQGVGEIFSKQPATGVGNIASGALSTLTSPIDAAQQVVGDVTGSKDIADRAGLVLNALPVAPALAKTANVGLKSLTTLTSPAAVVSKNKAFKNLVEMIGPENAGNVAKEMRADPRLTPADLSPAVKSATQKLFTIEGDAAKNHVSNFVNDRVNTAKAAVETAMDSSLGKTIDPVEKLKTLSDNIKKVGATEINPVLKATKSVDLTPVVEHIDNILRPGAMSVISNPENLLPYDKVKKLMQSYRDVMTNDKTVLTDPDVLNKLQSGMRRNAEGLMKSIDPEAKAMGYALHQLRQKVIDAVGKAGPQTVDKEGNAISAYRAGLSKYRDENHIADAFEEGHDSIISNSKKLLDRPEFFKKKVGEYTAEEKEAAKEGARIAIDTQINGFKSAARRGTDVGQIEFNKDRISSLFGKEEADKLFKKLENERKIAETNTHLIQNAQTAMRSAADSRVSLPTKTDIRNNALGIGAAEGVNMLTSGVPGVGTALYTAAKIGAWGKDKIATALAKEHNAQLAKLALPVQGPSRDELIKSLEAVANKPKRSLLRSANSLARLVGP